MSETDDPTVADDHGLFRRIHPDQIVPDRNTGKRRLSSGAFRDTRMSVDLEELLKANGRDTSFCLRHWPNSFLVRLLAALPRQHGQIIVPGIDDNYPENDAHAEVVGKKRDPVARALRDGASWVVKPSDVD